MNEDPPGGTIDVNGAALRYEEHGDGAPLILIHGGLASSAPSLIRDFARRHVHA
jgi:pimeloyl-ACP methyl ester carboxylesterase